MFLQKSKFNVIYEIWELVERLVNRLSKSVSVMEELQETSKTRFLTDDGIFRYPSNLLGMLVL